MISNGVAYEERIPSPLQCLILEGKVFDAELAVTALEGASCSCAWDRVQTREDLVARLDQRQYDLILADYLMPNLDGLSALQLVRERGIDTPFIVCSTNIGEEAVTEIFRAGATDYLLTTRLDRLPSVVARALKERDAKRERVHTEAALRQREQRAVAFLCDLPSGGLIEAECAVLLDIVTNLQGTLEVDEILDRVHRHILRLLPCDRVLTYCWNPARDAFELLAAHGVSVSPWADPAGGDVILAKLVEMWLDGGRPITHRIEARPWALSAWIDRLGRAALLSAPLNIGGAFGGVTVAVREDSSGEFEPRTIRLFERIVQQVAVAMATADIYRAKEEEVQLSEALAEVACQLISGCNSPALLDRLCQVTTRVLGCGRSYTAMWEPTEEAYVPVASHGYTAEEWEALQTVKLPRKQLADLLARLERRGVVSVLPSEDAARAALAATPPVTTSLWIALRRGGEVEGIHIATYDCTEADLPRHHARLGSELSQLASLAIENARLVDELTNANRLKSDFVATISHELRTPLNSILGYADLMLEESFGPVTAEQEKALQTVERSGRQLLDLVNATLDLSRLDAGVLPVNVTSTSLADLIAEIDADSRKLRDQSSLRFIWTVPPGLPQIETDPAKLKIVVTNLIGNAIKFTPHGSVTVTVGIREEGVEIAVTDTGIGIATDALPIIFEPFRQVDGSTTRHFGGVGLGLYIVRRLLELLGGTIEVESQVGSGSTFRVWVPRTIASHHGPDVQRGALSAL